MNTITQTMRFRQAIIKESLKNGVTKAAIKYKVNRQYIYRWRKRYDGTLQSLADKSHMRPLHWKAPIDYIKAFLEDGEIFI